MITKINSKTYHAIDALSASALKHFMRSPAHYQEYKLNPPKSTPAMEFGTLVHSLVLEPIAAAETYFCRDDTDILPLCVTKKGEPSKTPRNTDYYKSWREEMLISNEGKTLVSVEDWSVAVKIRKAIQAHPKASALLARDGESECALQWTHPTGVLMKGRPDFVTTGCVGVENCVKGDECGGRYQCEAVPRIVVDLKTTDDARPSAFNRTIFKQRYDIQAAMYCEGLEIITGKPHTFTFIVVEREAPHNVMVYDLPDEAIEIAKGEIDRQARLFKKCLESGVWGGYADVDDWFEMPLWAYSEV